MSWFVNKMEPDDDHGSFSLLLINPVLYFCGDGNKYI